MFIFRRFQDLPLLAKFPRFFVLLHVPLVERRDTWAKRTHLADILKHPRILKIIFFRLPLRHTRNVIQYVSVPAAVLPFDREKASFTQLAFIDRGFDDVLNSSALHVLPAGPSVLTHWVVFEGYF